MMMIAVLGDELCRWKSQSIPLFGSFPGPTAVLVRIALTQSMRADDTKRDASSSVVRASLVVSVVVFLGFLTSSGSGVDRDKGSD